MLKLKHARRVELRHISPALFEKYKEYLLGDYVYELRASGDHGGMIQPWTLVLSYEHAIRKRCYRLMSQKAIPFKQALETAWKETTVKERHFITPRATLSLATLAVARGRTRARTRETARARRAEPPITSPSATATTASP